MKWNEYLKKHGKCDRTLPQERLNELGDSLFDRWVFTVNARSGAESDDDYLVTGVKSEALPKVFISLTSMGAGCKVDEMNRAGYVKTVYTMFHEYRHLMQHEAMFTNEDDGMTDIVRRQLVRTFFRSSYEDNYLTDPGEADAALYGMKKTVEYFKDDPVVDSREAEEILYEFMTADNNRFTREWLKDKKPETLQDVITAYEDISAAAADVKYDINPETRGEDWDLTEYLFTEHPAMLEAFQNAGTGREQDRVLEDLIMLEYPSVIMNTVRLEDELTDVFITLYAVPEDESGQSL